MPAPSPELSLPGGQPFTATLPSLIRAAGEAYGDAEFLVLENTRITFREAVHRSAELARQLLALGLAKEARVGLLMSNRPEWALAWFAIARAGGLTVPFSTFYQAPEIAWCLRHTDIETLIVEPRYLDHDYLDRLERAIPGLADLDSPELALPGFPFLRRILVWGACDRKWALSIDSLAQLPPIRRGIDDAFLTQVEAAITPADRLLIICTSGSTAEPKAVIHTHGVATRITNAFLDYLDMRRGDRNYTGQPFFWIGGLNVNLLPALQSGACLVFSAAADAGEIARVVEAEKVTRLSLWPAQIKAIREAAERDGRSLESVRSGLGPTRDEAGIVIPPDRRMGGVLGMTESFGMHSIDRRTVPLPRGKGGTWGRHLPGVERRIVDPASGQPLLPGTEGELQVRGYTLMQGYYKREREEVFLPDGFFATGDLCTIDEDDFLFFGGRLGEMIKTSGANVSPREVELRIESYAEVQEAIVFGVEDALRGEAIVAIIVPAEGQSFNEPTIRARLRQDLSHFKVPHRFVPMQAHEIPRTGSAKPRKNVLRALLAERDATTIQDTDRSHS